MACGAARPGAEEHVMPLMPSIVGEKEVVVYDRNCRCIAVKGLDETFFHALCISGSDVSRGSARQSTGQQLAAFARADNLSRGRCKSLSGICARLRGLARVSHLGSLSTPVVWGITESRAGSGIKPRCTDSGRRGSDTVCGCNDRGGRSIARFAICPGFLWRCRRAKLRASAEEPLSDLAGM